MNENDKMKVFEALGDPSKWKLAQAEGILGKDLRNLRYGKPYIRLLSDLNEKGFYTKPNSNDQYNYSVNLPSNDIEH